MRDRISARKLDANWLLATNTSSGSNGPLKITEKSFSSKPSDSRMFLYLSDAVAQASTSPFF
ncbi:hypothetical protein [Nostoc sp. NOS(2021)]|uniref:hypothetical protein n=1 Tax=Nostoc sp. NOS(2021) TaxID=2815407 RepID=UPI0025D96C9C|nr:hypothetical protein [Nostoc sp. NOS(2021)]